MARIELTDEELEYFRANYGRLSSRIIGERLHVSHATVFRLADRYGIEPLSTPDTPLPTGRGHGRPWTEADRQTLLAMIDAGSTWPEIAVVLNRSENAIRSYKSLWYPGYPNPPHSFTHKSKRR